MRNRKSYTVSKYSTSGDFLEAIKVVVDFLVVIFYALKGFVSKIQSKTNMGFLYVFLELTTKKIYVNHAEIELL
ncbi:hypothetical protein L1987_11761 [Smallanthus sonchifolius]|uniref:Uncharacterized protein n=1 Tax=Smallanthus sonchifolius TaxID=185202 RepID=A0ACB9JBW8_9ASTR|nr:hypothetical protein L1987_11761 [Smallanthus sonchifolius]